MLNNIAKRFANYVAELYLMNLQPYKYVCIAPDGAKWSLREDYLMLKEVLRNINIPTLDYRLAGRVTRQSVFYCSQFMIPTVIDRAVCRIAFPYYHGIPNTGYPEFDSVYEALAKHHDRISAIQYTNEKMKSIILSTGISGDKIFKIPIGFDSNNFNVQSAESKVASRKILGLPEEAFIIGSFQKDGVGWDDGYKPKLIKGPDIYLEVVGQLKQRIPNLFVLLSGPSRGYVIQGLKSLGIPYKHIFIKKQKNINRLYQALDLYLVTSRDEGGPKAVLESMASGIILVSTSVGQAPEILENNKNGFLVDTFDSDEIAEKVLEIHKFPRDYDLVRENARITALGYDYRNFNSIWVKLVQRLVGSDPEVRS